MGLLDKVKGMLRGNKKQVNDTIDKGADMAKDKIPDQHDAKVDMAADKAKDAIDKLDG
jgi:hypothetical protein